MTTQRNHEVAFDEKRIRAMLRAGDALAKALASASFKDVDVRKALKNIERWEKAVGRQ